MFYILFWQILLQYFTKLFLIVKNWINEYTLWLENINAHQSPYTHLNSSFIYMHDKCVKLSNYTGNC